MSMIFEQSVSDPTETAFFKRWGREWDDNSPKDPLPIPYAVGETREVKKGRGTITRLPDRGEREFYRSTHPGAIGGPAAIETDCLAWAELWLWILS